MSNTDLKLNTVEWNEIDWRKVELSVFKLQKRIYQASKTDNVRTLRRLQKTLLNSYHAKLLTVRRVTQDNTGKKTAGVDGVKSLSPKQRHNLVQSLKLDDKSKPVRRVWIPKSNGKERPLGIPVMEDRAKQALIKSALEPEWENKFEPNSYGFRPGRSCHDAIESIFSAIRYKSKYVLDADISKCFDRINHEELLKKVNTFPKARRQLKAWLKAGILDKGKTIEKVIEHYRKLVDIIDKHKAVTQHKLIANLAPVIIGWCNYYKTVCSKETYSKVNSLLFYKLLRWGYRRHPNKNKTWSNKKYWHTIGMNNWRFSCKMDDIEYILPMHPETKITRHIKVKGEASPYDGNATYWASRMGKHPEVKATIARLLKKQKGRCNLCNLTFKPEDKIEKDHIIPRQAGGNKLTNNLQLLHKHCHNVKTKTDLIVIKRYKIKKVWERVYIRFQSQFDKTKWTWENDLPTLV